MALQMLLSARGYVQTVRLELEDHRFVDVSADGTVTVSQEGETIGSYTFTLPSLEMASQLCELSNVLDDGDPGRSAPFAIQAEHMH